jgi:hypothetical protein
LFSRTSLSSNIDVDFADDGSGGFEFLVAGQIRGTRLFYSGVFLIGELGRKPRVRQRCGEGGEGKQPATIG